MKNKNYLIIFSFSFKVFSYIILIFFSGKKKTMKESTFFFHFKDEEIAAREA